MGYFAPSVSQDDISRSLIPVEVLFYGLLLVACLVIVKVIFDHKGKSIKAADNTDLKTHLIGFLGYLFVIAAFFFMFILLVLLDNSIPDSIGAAGGPDVCFAHGFYFPKYDAYSTCKQKIAETRLDESYCDRDKCRMWVAIDKAKLTGNATSDTKRYTVSQVINTCTGNRGCIFTAITAFPKDLNIDCEAIFEANSNEKRETNPILLEEARRFAEENPVACISQRILATGGNGVDCMAMRNVTLKNLCLNIKEYCKGTPEETRDFCYQKLCVYDGKTYPEGPGEEALVATTCMAIYKKNETLCQGSFYLPGDIRHYEDVCKTFAHFADGVETCQDEKDIHTKISCYRINILRAANYSECYTGGNLGDKFGCNSLEQVNYSSICSDLENRDENALCQSIKKGLEEICLPYAHPNSTAGDIWNSCVPNCFIDINLVGNNEKTMACLELK